MPATTPPKRGRLLPKLVTLGLAFSLGLVAAEFDWNLPTGFPRPYILTDNPINAAKVELGRFVFTTEGFRRTAASRVEAVIANRLAFGRTRACRGHNRADPAAEWHESGHCAHCSVVDTGECDARIARKTGTRAHAERNPVELEFKETRAGSRYIVKGRPKTPRDPVFLRPPRRRCFQYHGISEQSDSRGAGIVTLERIPGAVSSTRAFCSPSISASVIFLPARPAPIVTTAEAVRTVLPVLNPAVIAPICNPCQDEVQHRPSARRESRTKRTRISGMYPVG